VSVSNGSIAVAVDLGATSMRFALGRLQEDAISYEIVEQLAHEPNIREGRLQWDAGALLGFCRRACEFAASASPDATVGVDCWGVDHGFLDREGRLMEEPACYRDPAHQRVFEELAEHRDKLFELTGVAHQPFNTVYQLVARRREHPEWEAPLWLMLPELMGRLLGAPAGHELTQASTTQLLGTDGQWCAEAFQIAGWPVPEVLPRPPGEIAGKTNEGVPIARVGGHDTASAVCGLGTLEPDEAFLNVGTWSLLGCLLDEPLVSAEAQQGNFSNERAVDGRVRFLKNIPGFYVINRLHEELGVSGSVPDWIARADRSVTGRVDLFDPAFFSPESMLESIRRSLAEAPATAEAWAGVALMSLSDCVADQLTALERVAGRSFAKLRLAGGGSKSRALCEAIANASGRSVLAGPAEATVLGNLGAQFLAQGRFGSWDELGTALRRSLEITLYFPSR
jgi:rhamnulokinase